MLYPDGYGTKFVSLDEMRARHEPRMHPEFARRFFRYVEHKKGLLGVGGGFRRTQPIKPGFAPPGKSFHEAQTFASGLGAYCAVDLVAPTVGGVHRSPTWDETADAPSFLLHTFVKNEPWHIQPIEIRGHGSWVAAGRPDPINPNPSPPDPLEIDEDIMIAYIGKPPAGKGNRPWILCINGAARYATTVDAEHAIEQGWAIVDLNEDQYGHLHDSVFN